MNDQHAYLDGLRSPLRLVNCGDLAQRLSDYFPRWSHRVLDRDQSRPWATLVHAAGKYRVDSDFQDSAVFHRDELNAVCDVIAKSAYQVAKENPDQLALHMAAIEICGRLVLFPAVRRAGKSLLSVALSRLGVSVFTDDALPLRIVAGERITGIATGVSPRIRLPLPENIAPELTAYIANNTGPSNSQYGYLASEPLACQGRSAPVGAIVLLEHAIGQAPKLEPANRGAVLERLIHHDFFRARDTRSVLPALHHLVEQAMCFKFSYSEPNEGALHLAGFFQEQFSTSPLPAPVPNGLREVRDFEGVVAPLEAAKVYRVTDNLEILDVEGTFFATDSLGHKIIQLDIGALQILELLQQPMRLAEVVQLLWSAFPEAAPQDIARQTHDAFGALVADGLLVAAR